ncbi:MAG TPA: AI-2E family transporter [Candidatus Rubrimentiphilum sp.]|nr:AI-2E family transporter [Candidatus Rubrimentiphilum sp.]
MTAVFAVVALSLAYAILTWPLVRRLERRMPRVAAIIFIDSAVAIIIGALGFAFAPLLYAQGQAIGAALPGAGEKVMSTLPEAFQRWLTMFTAEVSLNAYAREAFAAIVTVIRSIAAFVGAAIVIPILAAYFQLDARRYFDALMTVVPAKWHLQTQGAITEISRSMGGIIRGQIIVSSLVGVLVYVVLAAMGVKFAALIAVVTALCDVVPYLGGIAAFLPSLLFALTFGGVARAVIVGILLLVVFEFEAQFLGPTIVGSNTRLAPSLIVIVLLAGTALFGVLGLFLAVPVTAVAGAGIRGFLTANVAERS